MYPARRPREKEGGGYWSEIYWWTATRNKNALLVLAVLQFSFIILQHFLKAVRVKWGYARQPKHSFPLPYLLWDKKEKKHHQLKHRCQPLAVHRLHRGFQVSRAQEHKASSRRLTQVWGIGGQTWLAHLECWFPQPWDRTWNAVRDLGAEGKETESSVTHEPAGFLWTHTSPFSPRATWNKRLWVAVSSSSSPFPLCL